MRKKWQDLQVRISTVGAGERSEDRIRAIEELVFRGALAWAIQNQGSPEKEKRT